MRGLVILIAGLFFAAAVHTQIVTKQPVLQGAVMSEKMCQRLEETAERTKEAAPNGAAHGAQVDFAWPYDADEYRALGKYIVVLISAVSQDASELPRQCVYV